jgi:hypothetical protein
MDISEQLMSRKWEGIKYLIRHDQYVCLFLK